MCRMGAREFPLERTEGGMGGMGSLGCWGGPTDAAGTGRDRLCQVTLAAHRTPGTGAQGVELEVRGDHEGLMRHGTGSLEGLDVSEGLRVSQSTFGSPWAGLGVVPGEWGGLLGPQEMGVPGDPD